MGGVGKGGRGKSDVNMMLMCRFTYILKKRVLARVWEQPESRRVHFCMHACVHAHVYV